jgi:mannose-6-phosphate isomerase-like protein (cupin superfamily)
MQPRSIHDFQEWFQVLQTAEHSQVAMMELVPGQSTGAEAESHPKSDQVLLVIAGAIQGEVDGKSVWMGQGQFLIIPADTKHRFFNDGPEAALTFNVYAAPAYPPNAKG